MLALIPCDPSMGLSDLEPPSSAQLALHALHPQLKFIFFADDERWWVAFQFQDLDDPPQWHNCALVFKLEGEFGEFREPCMASVLATFKVLDYRHNAKQRTREGLRRQATAWDRRWRAWEDDFADQMADLARFKARQMQKRGLDWRPTNNLDRAGLKERMMDPRMADHRFLHDQEHGYVEDTGTIDGKPYVGRLG